MAELFDEIRKSSNEDIKKFNPYHGADGRFTSAGGATSFTYKPGKGSMYDMAITGEQKRSESNFDPFEEMSLMANVPWFYEKPKTQEPPKKLSSALNDDGSPKGQVQGRNIVDSFELNDKTYPSGYAHQVTDQVAEIQGFKGKPAVVSVKEFEEAAKKSGVIAYRTLSAGADVVDGEEHSEIDFAHKLMYGSGEEFAMNGDGPTAYGGGIYMAANRTTDEPDIRGLPESLYSRHDSVEYGTSENPAVVKMTLSPTAKIADYADIRKALIHEPYEVYERFLGNEGAYAAARGWDGLRAKSAGSGCDYLIIMNRTALIVCEKVEDVSGDRWENEL